MPGDARPELPAVAHLDPAVLGRLLIEYVAAAGATGHDRLASALQGHVAVGGEEAPAEAGFIVEALTRPVPEIIARWYGGQGGAAAIARAAASAESAGGGGGGTRLDATLQLVRDAGPVTKRTEGGPARATSRG